MVDKFVAPIVVGLVVGFVLLFGTDVKEWMLSSYQITYQVIDSKKLLSSTDVGRKEIPILGKKVSDVYLTQVVIRNTGKKSIKDVDMLLDVTPANNPGLYRVFYVTEPRELFDGVSFSDFKSKFSKKLTLKEFVRGNSISISFISSEHLGVNFIGNKGEVNFKLFNEKESVDGLTYVAIMSALSVLIGRLLIDLFGFLLVTYLNKVKSDQWGRSH